MRARQRFTALFVAALIMAGSLPVITVRAERDGGTSGGQEVSVETTEEEPVGQNTAEASGEERDGQNTAEESGEEKTEQEGIEESCEEPTDLNTVEESGEEPTEQEGIEESCEEPTDLNTVEESGEEKTEREGMEESCEEPADLNTVEESGEGKTEREDMEESCEEPIEQEGTEVPGEEPQQQSPDESDANTTDVTEVETVYPVPSEPPAFSARIERLPRGYVVNATFTDFTPDIAQIYMLYSLNGEDWRQTPDEFEWNLEDLGTENKYELYNLQNQVSLHESYEPLKNYVAGEIDHFYIKLCIVKQNGLSFESQAATIERGGLQPIPEGAQCTAYFASEMTVRKPNPQLPRLPLKYGGYQLTVSADATAEDILALLPDTLPITVEIICGSQPYASDTVECPVTWKPLSFSQPSAGESITVPDAAEKIVVPAGTRLKTPVGNFELDQALGLSKTNICFDQVELTVNIIPEEESNPTGVLRAGLNGLEIALNQKPVGATAIEAYVLTEGESKWTELSGLSLLSDMNAQHATASSGYSLVMRNYQEPYQSYLDAVEAGAIPVPFYVGLKIQGGIYDGKQLILAWPDIYEQLPDLPEVGGCEGNEGNAGADNKDDSTEGGQRPNLPQVPDDDQGEQSPNPPADDTCQEEQPSTPPPADDVQQGGEQPPIPPPADDAQQGEEQPPTPPSADDTCQEEQPSTPPPADDAQQGGEQPPVSPLMPADDAQEIGEHLPADDDQDKLRQISPTTQNQPSASDDNRQEEQASTSRFPSAEDTEERQLQPLLVPTPQETGQRPNLPQTMPDTADASAENQADSVPLEPLVVQAAVNVREKENISDVSVPQTVIEPVTVTEQGSHAYLLAVTATVSTVAAGGCIGVAVFKLTGHGLFHQIGGMIRKIFHIRR